MRSYNGVLDVQPDSDAFRYCRELPPFRVSDQPADVKQLIFEAETFSERLINVQPEIDAAISAGDYARLAALEVEKTHGAGLHRSALLRARRAEAGWLNGQSQIYVDLGSAFTAKWAAAVNGDAGPYRNLQEAAFELRRLEEAGRTCEAALSQIMGRLGEVHREIEHLQKPYRSKHNFDGSGEMLPRVGGQIEATPASPTVTVRGAHIIQYGDSDLRGPSHEREGLPGFEADGSVPGWHAAQKAKAKADRKAGR